MTWIEWYNSLGQPSWTPSPSTVSLIWMILYPGIFAGFGFVFVRGVSPPSAVAGSPAGRRQSLDELAVHADVRRAAELLLSAANIVMVWATIIWFVISVWRHYRWVDLGQGPYFV